MTDKKQSRYKYSNGQKELNRTLKMQEMQLQDLEKKSNDLSSSIADNDDAITQTRSDVDDLIKQAELLRAQVLQMASEQGVDVPNHLKKPVNLRVERPKVNDSTYLSDEKISTNDIPSWDAIMKKTDEMRIPEEVVLEDLLSPKEFQYCIEDIERIHNEFAQKTKLSKVDIAFLMTATALQTARWIIIQHLMGDLGETVDKVNRIHNKEGDKQKKKDVHDWSNKHDDHSNKHSTNGFPTWKDIIFGQYTRIDGGKSMGVCPYDAQNNAPAGFDEGGRGNHRVYTLGHDPILGWIFGTANLMTCTISLSKKFNFATYNVEYPYGRFSDVPTSMIKMFSDVFQSTKEDKFRLAAALFAQYAHLKSDVFTERGLPIPIIESFSEELTGKLYAEQYDALCLARDAAIVGSQAAFSILINMIIGFVHGLFYNKEKDGRRDHYEVRTRKILLYSNAISSSINLAYVGVNAYAGNVGDALKKLDLGGLLVTLWRLFSDIRFITKVKEQYINEELDKVTKDAIADLDAMFEQ